MDKTKWTHSDRECLAYWAAALDCLSRVQSMERRLRAIPNGWRLYKSAYGMVGKIFDGLLLSMPIEQLKHFQRQLPSLRINVGVKNTFRPNDDGRWLADDEIVTLVVAAHERCTVCTLDDAEQRKCKLRQLLDNLPQGEAGDETDERYGSTGCKYSVLQ